MTVLRRSRSSVLCALGFLLASCHKPPQAQLMGPDEAGEFLGLLPSSMRLPALAGAQFDPHAMSLFFRVDQTGVYWGHRERMRPHSWRRLFTFGPEFQIPREELRPNEPDLFSVKDITLGWRQNLGHFDGRIAMLVDERVPSYILAMMLNSVSVARPVASVIVGSRQRHGALNFSTQRLGFPSMLTDVRRARFAWSAEHPILDLGGTCPSGHRRCVALPAQNQQQMCDQLSRTPLASDATLDEFGLSVRDREPVGNLLRVLQACRSPSGSPLRSRSVVLLIQTPPTCENEQVACDAERERALTAWLGQHHREQAAAQDMLMGAANRLSGLVLDGGLRFQGARAPNTNAPPRP